MKNCELFVSSPELASASSPFDAKVYAVLNSSAKSGRVEPPTPLPVGEPPWITKLGTIRWKSLPT